MDLLSSHHDNGRRFEVTEAVEGGASVVLGLTISQPDWSGPVEVFKAFKFGPADTVVQMQDCDSRETAIAMLTDG